MLPLRCFTNIEVKSHSAVYSYKCLPRNTKCLQRQWTCQLLCGSALLPHLSLLKLASLPLVSGASLLITLLIRSETCPLQWAILYNILACREIWFIDCSCISKMNFVHRAESSEITKQCSGTHKTWHKHCYKHKKGLHTVNSVWGTVWLYCEAG